MLALGLQGSPRKKGNSDFLLSLFMDELGRRNMETRVITATQPVIEPCKELTVCEKKGYCPIDDDMSRDIYALLRRADIIVAASPVFFYNVSAQLKALIDRCQMFWARKYKLKLRDPGHPIRRGFLLAVGASSGKQLFDGLHLTAKYFFDAVDADYRGALTYHRIETRGQIKEHPTVREDVAQKAAAVAEGLTKRRKVLFAGRENAGRSQMAAAFARLYGGHLLDVYSAGSRPAERVDPAMVEVMQEKGIDMGFLKTAALEETLKVHRFDAIISTGGDEPLLPSTAVQEKWETSAPAEPSLDEMRRVRDEIERKVSVYLESQQGSGTH